MPRLFALDHNFPDPIVAVLAKFQKDAELVRIDQIDPRMPDLEDWELLLALHHHASSWDGLITTDSSMLHQGRELATLMHTRLTLVVAMETGHNPVKASGKKDYSSSAEYDVVSGNGYVSPGQESDSTT